MSAGVDANKAKNRARAQLARQSLPVLPDPLADGAAQRERPSEQKFRHRSMSHLYPRVWWAVSVFGRDFDRAVRGAPAPSFSCR